MMGWNIGMYNSAITEASKSALVEVLRSLRSYSEFFVLAGGWAPYYILERFAKTPGFTHCGSVDIDLVMDVALREAQTYATIVQLLSRRGFQQHIEDAYRFDKTIVSPVDGQSYDIPLDFITEPTETRLQEGLVAAGIKGYSIALRHSFKHLILGVLPGNGEATVEARVADVVGCLTTKGLAMKSRYKEKDPYDVYTVVSYFKNGPRDTAEEFRDHLEDPTVKEALQTIRKQFSNALSEGPYSVARFMYPADAAMQDRIRTDAFMRLEEFFSRLTQ